MDTSLIRAPSWLGKISTCKPRVVDNMAVRDDGFNLLMTLPIPEFAQKRNLLRPISLKDLFRIDLEPLIQKLMDAGVLHKERACHVCNEPCRIVPRMDVADKCCWRCTTSSSKCSRPKISIRKGFHSFLPFFWLLFFLTIQRFFFRWSKLAFDRLDSNDFLLVDVSQDSSYQYGSNSFNWWEHDLKMVGKNKRSNCCFPWLKSSENWFLSLFLSLFLSFSPPPPLSLLKPPSVCPHFEKHQKTFISFFFR